MMAAIRAFAKSWVAAVLMGILIISFAVWGVRDIFHPRLTDWVIKAGAREVSSTEFKQAFDRQLQTVQQQSGQVVSAQDAVAAGLDQRMLQDMATSESIAELIRLDGIQPSDKLLAQELGKIPAFFNPITGTFDKATYEKLLNDNKLTDTVFERDLMDRISASQFGAGMQAGYQAPLTYSALLGAFQLQGRSADFFVFDPHIVGQPPKPTDAQLQQYIKENTARFTRPELRMISLVRFSAAHLAETAKVDPGDVQKQFDFAKDRLSTPEKRTFVQVPASDANQAALIAAQLNKGADASAVARSLGAKPVSYAEAAKSTVADPAVADAAFSLSEGQVSGPIRGQLGFAVVKVLHITPGKPATLEEARPQIEKDLRQHAAEEQVNDQVQKYEDSHDTGALLAQSAKVAGVQVFELGPMTQQGVDLRTRQQITGLNQKMLADAFSLTQGAETDVTQLAKGEYYAIRVEKVLPQAVPPLEEIRQPITMDYMQHELIKRVQARADQFADRIKKGESLEAVAASTGAKVQHIDSMSRVAARQAVQSYGEAFLGALFDAKPSGVFTAGVTGGIAVARLTAISSGDMGQIARAAQAQRSNLTREMGGPDLQESVQNAARTKIKPKVDQKRVLQTLGVQPETAASSAKPAKPAGMIFSPEFEAFAAAYDAGRPQAVYTRIIDDLETPVSAYLKIGRARSYAFLFESVEGGAWRGRYSVLTLEPDLIWRCRGNEAEISEGDQVAAGAFQPESGGALHSLKRLIERSRIELPPELPPMAAGVFGALGYDTVRLVEDLPACNPDPLGLPDAVMTRPGVVAVFDFVAQEIVLTAAVWPQAGLSAREAYDQATARLAGIAEELKQPLPPHEAHAPWTPEPFQTPVSRADYHGIVDRAKDYIRAGDIFQVVPSHRMRTKFELDTFAFYRALRRLNPSPFMFYLNFGDFQLAGSSPEIMVRLRDGKITIRPIAGTRPRGGTPTEDARLEQELLADPKERAEHLMLLDLGRNDVGRVAALGPAGANAARAPSVRVTESFTIERYSHVMHIVSNVEGDAPKDVDPVDVLMAALPAGTLSGAPKVRAMEIIDELESEKRGIAYAGAAGYIAANGAVDTCILLRTALFQDGMMYVQAGGGVVADSDPDAEYDETLHKARALARAADEAWRFA